MLTTFKATVRTLLLTPSAVIWTLIFPIVLATVFNFMFEPMRSTGSVEAVKVAVVADDAWEDSPFSQVVDTLSEADEPLLAVHPVAGEEEARVLLAEGSVAGAYVVDAAGESTATPSASAAGAPRIILAPRRVRHEQRRLLRRQPRHPRIGRDQLSATRGAHRRPLRA